MYPQPMTKVILRLTRIHVVALLLIGVSFQLLSHTHERSVKNLKVAQVCSN